MTTSTKPSRPRAEVVALLREIGVIPVIRADSAPAALRVIETLADAELPIAEVTLTVPDAMAVIATAARRFAGGVLIGAGTVTDTRQAADAARAGAEFIVSPGLVPDVVASARQAGLAVLPGALTPTELMHATALGADMVKIFPAQAVGGASYVRALRGPFPNVLLVPTGGVTLDTVGEYIRAGAAAVGVGSELVSRDALERGDYSAIGSLARQFVASVREVRAEQASRPTG
jgi:2-dehydro-3-deoxyphosphogluconate aldolase/(4S)-4-hydroxy-2-oxoglutarate aldolase